VTTLLILAAAAANSALGALWYTYFGDDWLAALGKRKGDIDPKNPRPYVVAVAGSLLNAFGLRLCLQVVHPPDLRSAIGLGAALALTLSIATAAKHYAFSGWSLRLFCLDYGLDTLGYALMSAILYYKLT
jgi:hypothetical protein